MTGGMRGLIDGGFESQVTVCVHSGVLQVLIADLPHLMFKLKDFLALQSWQDYERFHIEVYLKQGTVIHTEYTEDYKWKVILTKTKAVLDRYL